VKIIVISTETNPVVGARCRKLGLEFIQACDDKLAALERVVQEHGLSPQQVAYVGNDLNDLDCLRWVGLPIAVADAVPEIRGIARLVTSRPGGLGAVREVTDWLIAAHDGVASPEAQPVFDANSFSKSHRGGTSASKG
jgi:YrbI family 3-deoxy-D-manno-octulosonate 8-phosphate phosphatase